MRRTLWGVCGVAILALATFASQGQSNGRLVSREEAASIQGGCAGVGANYCSGIDLPCIGSTYGSGGTMDFDTSTIVGYWCVTTVNHERVCDTCAKTYVSCATVK